ncbi:MAG: alpha-amylase family glycosyl hydrolase [Candidatus Eisenbacteria bacterium]
MRVRPFFFSLFPVLLLAAASGPAAADPVTFRYAPGKDAEQIFVAGDWNQWDPAADALTDEDGNGIFEATLDLAPGRHEYKFVVDGDWVEDPGASESAPNPYGSANSVIYAGGARPKPETYRIGPIKKSAGTEMREVKFFFRGDPVPSRVFLAGTFNEWKPDALPMSGPDSEGAFATTLLLGPGEVLYKFVADGVWRHDAENDRTVDDGFGGLNSVLLVDDRFPKVAIVAGDGSIREGTLNLETDAHIVRTEPERLVVTARAFQGDVTGASLLFRRRGEETRLPMRGIGEDGRYTYFRGELEMPVETEGRLGVLFRDGSAERIMTRTGLTEKASDADLIPVGPMQNPLFSMPDWVVDGVFYQIFPERFRNGSKKNDPDFSEPWYAGKTELPESGTTNGEYYHLVHDWYDVEGLKKSPYRTDGRPDYFSFYGGDLEGVQEMIPYLKDLGVTILYFNPLHTAKSNHKYDACDYREVDPHFGGNEAFRALAETVHEAGMRIVVDGVFNHTGNCHYAFRECVEKGKESPYWTWYEWKKWPIPESWGPSEKAIDYYDCWWGFGDLPNLNFDLARLGPVEQEARRVSDAKPNWPVIEEIRETVRFWLGDLGADGFRLDVANEVPAWFWKLFREEVRKVKPDGYVIAELWGDAASELSPLQFDATMNYRYFREPALAFFAQSRIDARTFDLQIAGGRYSYPLPSVLGAMNLLGSHDTERFLTSAGGDTRRLLLATLFSVTYIGAPHIYYGDEIGMAGGPDPDCRRPFGWKRLEEPSARAIRERIRHYLGMRREHPALRRGDFRTLLADRNLFAFARWKGGDRLAVILNAGNAPAEIVLEAAALPFPAERARDLFAGQDLAFEEDALTIRLEPFAGAVLAFPESAGSD